MRKYLQWLVIIAIVYFVFVRPLFADWFRVQSSTPIRNRTNIFVATYVYQGPVDYSIPNSKFPLYLTVIYDLDRPQAKVFSRVTASDKESNAAHHEAEEYAITTMTIKGNNTVYRRLFQPDSDNKSYKTQDGMEE
jgi:hypothetical protein